MNEEDIAAICARLSNAHRFLILRMTDKRWVKGTGFVHRSVGTDLVNWGIATPRQKPWHTRLIRLNALGLRVKAHLEQEAGMRGELQSNIAAYMLPLSYSNIKAALRPFAGEADRLDQPTSNSIMDSAKLIETQITYGDVRRARATLAALIANSKSVGESHDERALCEERMLLAEMDAVAARRPFDEARELARADKDRRIEIACKMMAARFAPFVEMSAEGMTAIINGMEDFAQAMRIGATAPDPHQHTAFKLGGVA